MPFKWLELSVPNNRQPFEQLELFRSKKLSAVPTVQANLFKIKMSYVQKKQTNKRKQNQTNNREPFELALSVPKEKRSPAICVNRLVK